LLFQGGGFGFSPANTFEMRALKLIFFVRAFAGGSVKHGDAEPATIGLFKLREVRGQVGETPRSRMENARKRESGSCEKRSSAQHTRRNSCL
jgi:hypothetical protein